MPRVYPKKAHWPRSVYEAAQTLYNDVPTPTAADLARLLRDELKDFGRSPGESTVRDWIAKGFIAIDPDDAPWSLAHGEPEDAELVLRSIRWATEAGQPRPTKDHALWIVRIQRAARRELNGETAYRLAIHARRSPRDLRRVEQYLSYEPWLDEGAGLDSASESGFLDFGIVFLNGGIEPQDRKGKGL